MRFDQRHDAKMDRAFEAAAVEYKYLKVASFLSRNARYDIREVLFTFVFSFAHRKPLYDNYLRTLL